MKAKEYLCRLPYNHPVFDEDGSDEFYSEKQLLVFAEEYKDAELKESREKNKQANKFIKDMAEAIGMDLDGQITISIKNVEKHLADMGWVVKQSNKEEQT